MLLSTKASEFVLSGIKGNGVKVETVKLLGEEWVKTTDKDYTESNSDITIETADYDCIRIETADMPIELKNLSVDSDGKLHGDTQYNSSDISQKVVLVAAKYNPNGSLNDVSTFDVVNEGAIDFGEYTVSADEQVKLFVWNSLNDMQPLSKVYTEDDISK